MTRLFDTHRRGLPPEQPNRKELAKAALEAAQMDATARSLGEALGGAQALQQVRYDKVRVGRWLIEHGRAGDDYLFHLHPLKKISASWQVVITNMIGAMDTVFPRTLQIFYKRPDETWQVNFFTAKVDKLCAAPGWQRAVQKAIEALGTINAWG